MNHPFANGARAAHGPRLQRWFALAFAVMLCMAAIDSKIKTARTPFAA